MRYNLNGFAQIVAPTLLIDHRFVDPTRGKRIILGGLNAGEAFVVSQVEIGLHAVYRNVALAVFVGVERSGIDIDVGIELLNGDVVASCLQEFTDGGGNDAFAERGNHASGNEDIFCFGHDCCSLN